MATATKKKEPPKEHLEAQERDRRRNELRKAGRLFRVHNTHPAIGSVEIEAKDEDEAIKKVAFERFPSQARSKEWLETFAGECRVVKLPPAVEPK